MILLFGISDKSEFNVIVTDFCDKTTIFIHLHIAQCSDQVLLMVIKKQSNKIIILTI